MINITDLAKANSPDYCTSLMALHAYSGCDTTSAFKGIGKVKPIKILEKTLKYKTTLSRLGEEWHVTSDVVKELDSFTGALYGKS